MFDPLRCRHRSCCHRWQFVSAAQSLALQLARLATCDGSAFPGDDDACVESDTVSEEREGRHHIVWQHIIAHGTCASHAMLRGKRCIPRCRTCTCYSGLALSLEIDRHFFDDKVNDAMYVTSVCLTHAPSTHAQLVQSLSSCRALVGLVCAACGGCLHVSAAAVLCDCCPVGHHCASHTIRHRILDRCPKRTSELDRILYATHNQQHHSTPQRSSAQQQAQMGRVTRMPCHVSPSGM